MQPTVSGPLTQRARLPGEFYSAFPEIGPGYERLPENHTATSAYIIDIFS